MEDHTSLPDKQIAKRLYEKIYHDIVRHRIRPGTKLNERKLAEEMGVSRTPIRETLFLLSASGLVKRYPNLGVVVTELSLRDVLEAFQIREFIEPPATAIASKVLREEDLRELTQQLEELEKADIANPSRYEQHDIIDARIHDLIIDSVGNSKLKSIVDSIQTTCTRARFLGTPVRYKESVNEHLEILNALIMRDSEQARECMRIHLANTRQRLVEFI